MTEGLKKIAVLLLLLVLVCAQTVPAFAEDAVSATLEEPNYDAYSDAYVVIDAQTGQVLVQKNMNKREYPASITKIMTIALGLERANLDDTFVVSEQAVNSVSRSSSHIALSAGEEITLADAIFGTLLPSANDAANAIADYIGGSIEMFVALMNKTAVRVGAYNTNFTNANGLEDENHYTTAYDMAMITKYALTVEGFREVLGTTAYTMKPTNMQPLQRNFGTQHHMIVYSSYQYKGAWGGKLGWTPQANHTAVTVAKRGDIELICVSMNSKVKWDKYKDTKKLFDYCFNNLERLTVSAEIDQPKTLPVILEKSVVGVVKIPIQTQEYGLLVKKGTDSTHIESQVSAKASYEKGERISPSVRFTQDGKELLNIGLACEVTMDEDLPVSTVLSDSVTDTEAMVYSTQSYISSFSTTQKLLLAAAVGVAGILTLLMLFMILRGIVRSIYRARRKNRSPFGPRY